MFEHIYFETYLGGIDKRLAVSDKGIEWMGTFWEYEKIERVRWAFGSDYMDGDRDKGYRIGWGDSNLCVEVELPDKSYYNGLVSLLQLNVANRIYGSYLKGLSIGNRYEFYSTYPKFHLFSRSKDKKPYYHHIIIDDEGVEFFKTPPNENPIGRFVEWQRVHTYSSISSTLLRLGHIGLMAAFSTFSVYNIKIFYELIDNFQKAKLNHPSELLCKSANKKDNKNFKGWKQESNNRNNEHDSEENQKSNNYDDNFSGGEKQASNNQESRTNEEFYRLLAVFELRPPTTTSEVKKKYHLLLKMFHPDKYNYDPELKAYAESKSKELTTAFSLLKRYFKE